MSETRTDAERLDALERLKLGVWHRASTGKWESMGGTQYGTAREAIDGALDASKRMGR